MTDDSSQKDTKDLSLNLDIVVYQENNVGPDVYYNLVKAKVRKVQAMPTSHYATDIQEAIVKNLKYFLGEVEKEEPLFQVSELIQVGSYAEGTKINNPDEFDFIAVIDLLSKEGTVRIEHISKAPGNVSVFLIKPYSNSALTKLSEDGKVNCLMEGLTTGDIESRPLRFGNVFVQVVSKAYMNTFEFTEKFDNTDSECPVPHVPVSVTPTEIEFGGGGLILQPINGKPLLLKRVQHKMPNIYLEYKYAGILISVDLSPAIRYHKIDNCVNGDKCGNPKLMKAVQKHGSLLLLVDKHVRDFRITVTESEVNYMQEIMKKHHKLLYILLKHVCHTMKCPPYSTPEAFTSFQLKQVWLHHDANCQLEKEKCLDCLEMITNDMIRYCTEKHLPSVLNEDVNLFTASNFYIGIEWHFKLHFLIALRLICQRSRNINNIEEFEEVLNGSIKQSAEKFTNYHRAHTEATWLTLNYPFDELPSLDITKEDILYCPTCDENTERFLN